MRKLILTLLTLFFTSVHANEVVIVPPPGQLLPGPGVTSPGSSVASAPEAVADKKQAGFTKLKQNKQLECSGVRVESNLGMRTDKREKTLNIKVFKANCIVAVVSSEDWVSPKKVATGVDLEVTANHQKETRKAVITLVSAGGVSLEVTLDQTSSVGFAVPSAPAASSPVKKQ